MTSWTTFWMINQCHFYDIMNMSTGFFARRFDKHFNIQTAHKILDYGCGPGFLADHLVSKKLEICGADINSSYLEECRRKHPSAKWVQTCSDIDKVQSIFESELHGKKFDFIVILSIVQYFKSAEEIENLIKLMTVYLTNKGKIVIADVMDPKSSSIWDGIALGWYTLMRGKIFYFIKFIKYLIFSDYRSLVEKSRLLELSEERAIHIAQSCSLTCTRINGMTIHPTRFTYVMSKT